MAASGVREEDILRQGSAAPGLRDAVFAVATRANDHLITAREMLKNVRLGQDVGHDFEEEVEGEGGHAYEPMSTSTLGAESQHVPLDSSPVAQVDQAFGVFMPAVATAMWLERLQRVDFDVFRPELRRRDWRLPWKAYVAFKRRTF